MEAMGDGEGCNIVMEVLGDGEGWKRKKLDVEDYLDFIDDRDLPLTVRQLREAILMEMVSTMELMDLQRSSLLDGVSGDASLTLKEVKDDLKSLSWQDCHVTSILTYGAGVASQSSAGVSLKRRRARRKVAKVAIEDSAASTTGTSIVAESTTVQSET
ncbi:hypothetical protein SASPL_122819 [Salvia splendens]|uniref:Uncharacterized protein n=1 Tax=Salvia splendens TaxID=180675 RepID=A0A8X8ZSL8_SALSN|nr:hypothetical protein SASPL_122819 [Salvia splendens]